MLEKRITCIVCPIGCEVLVKGNENKIVEISGYKCKRGINYAKSEFIAPMRIFTSTVKIKHGPNPVIPVRTNKPIPKSKILDCMKVIRSIELEAPVKEGETVVKNVLETRADIVASTNFERN